MRQEIRNGRFRADLYHRLSVFTIDMPPLRDLGDDKRLLLDHFRDFYAKQAATKPFELDAASKALWLDYSFPGNVRELRNIVIRLTTKHAGAPVNAEQLQSELDMESMELELPGLPLGQDFKSVLDAAKRHLQMQKNFNLDLTLQEWEKGYVEAALKITQGNLSQAAKLLGIHRTTLYSRMQNYGTAEETQRAQ
jgi:DNA-binding NtrC family response regulator